MTDRLGPTAALLVLLAACGDDDASPARDGGPLDLGAADTAREDAAGDASGDAAAAQQDGSSDASMAVADAAADAEPDATAPSDAGPVACPRAPRPEDAERFVVVSHPYLDGGGTANAYEVLRLGADGTLSTLDDTRFSMGRSTGGRIELTPDGEVGLVAQEDGTLGVFRLDDNGHPSVVHEAFEGAFYASSIVIDPDGRGAWVLDAQWRESGGGLYRVLIGCDGTLTDEGRVAEAKLPYALLRVPGRGDRLVLAAADVLDSPPGADLHLLADGVPPVRLASSDAFGDDDFIVGALEVTSDGRFALVGDGNAFSGIPNRVAVVGLEGDVLDPLQVLSPIEDPTAIVASPFGGLAIVVSGFGDAIVVLQSDPGAEPPFRSMGELAYEGTSPQLPGAAVRIDRGALRGHVLVAENLGVRQVVFEPGAVRDLGLFALGSDTPSIVGAIGVTP